MILAISIVSVLFIAYVLFLVKEVRNAPMLDKDGNFVKETDNR